MKRLPRVHTALMACGMATMLSACKFEPWMDRCAECGEVRSISERPVQTIYDVRVRMDAGGSRDLAMPDVSKLHIGERVEVRGARIVPHSGFKADPLWL